MSIWGSVIEGAVSIGGAIIGGNANNNAANTAAQGSIAGAQIAADAAIKAAEIQQQGAQYAADLSYQAGREARQDFQEARDRGIAAITAGTDDYLGYVEPILAPREDITMEIPYEAPPGQLTPDQAIMREDLLRTGIQNLAAGGMRGAGRAGQAVLADLDRRFMADAYRTNLGRKDLQFDRQSGNLVRTQAERDRQDAARQVIGGVVADEGRQIANVEMGTGSQMGAAAQTAGEAAAGQITAGAQAAGAGVATAGRYSGGAVSDAAQYRADAGLANADLYGRTIGQIGSLFADEVKSKNRYADYQAPGG